MAAVYAVLLSCGVLKDARVFRQRLFCDIDDALEYLVYWSVHDGKPYRMVMYSGETRGLLALSKTTWTFNASRFEFSEERRRALLDAPKLGVAHVTSGVSGEIAFQEDSSGADD